MTILGFNPRSRNKYNAELSFFDGVVDTRLHLSDYLPLGDPDGTAKAGSWYLVSCAC